MASARSATTGDIKNNLMKLLREIQRMKLQVEPNVQGLSLGSPSSFLPILHTALMHYSLPLANWLTRHDYDLFSKSDLRFLEGMYKVLREVFHYHPRLSREQFLSTGFAEQKIILSIDILRYCQAKHRELVGRRTARSKRKWQETDTSRNTGLPEVLTVHDMSGISTAWSEPPRATVVEGDNTTLTSTHLSLAYTPPPSPEPTTHPHTSMAHTVVFTPTKDLELTPNPTPLRGNLVQHSSPLRTRSITSGPLQLNGLVPPDTDHIPLQAITVPVHNKEIVIRHSAPPTNGDPSGREMVTKAALQSNDNWNENKDPPAMQLRPAVTTSEGDTASGDDCSSRGESPESWHSLPLHEEEREATSQPEREGAPDQVHPHTPQFQESLDEIGSRMEQLTRLVERMSARFVLLETQLKMVESQTPREKQLECSPETIISSSKSRDLLTPHKGKAAIRGPHEQAMSGSVSRSLGTTPVGPKAVVGPRILPCGGLSTTTPPSLTHGQTPAPLTHGLTPASLTHGQTPVCTTPASLTYGQTPPSLTHGQTPVCTTPASLTYGQTPPSLTHGLTPVCTTPASLTHGQTPPSLTHGLIPVYSTPSTPEDTRKMIENLRDRARRTKDFLHKANSRHTGT